ncbi:MAG: phage virion morphogenesis protein [Sebaldella sp.]|nr:phage virion morphogenesis protein [Sebaldella sp.]
MKTKLKVIKSLKNLEKRVNTVKNMYDTSFLTGKISKDMKKEVDMRFRNESSPDGKPWKGLKSNSIISRYNSGLKKKRGKKAVKGRPKILQNTGRLKRSILARNTKTEAIVGTNTKYAATHNFGDLNRNIPKRKFMGLNRDQRIKYKDWIIKWKKGQLK